MRNEGDGSFQSVPAAYSPREYWERVGRRMGLREEKRSLAGEESPFYDVKRSMFLEKLLQPIIGESAETFLEVGCGPGGNLAWLESRGVTALGIDLTYAMLQIARENELTRLVGGDGGAIPLHSGSVDAAMTVTVLQHNDDVAAAKIIGELARVARSHIHIFEDTGVVAAHRRASHWLRKPEWYIAELHKTHFRLLSKERLPLATSELLANLLRSVARRHVPEGSAVPQKQQNLEAQLLRFTTRVDSVIPPVVGLTRLSFVRSDAG